MSLARGKFGIEYNPRQMEREPSGLGWVLAVVALVALVSLAWTMVHRMRTSDDGLPGLTEAVLPPVAEPPPPVNPQGEVVTNDIPAPAAAPRLPPQSIRNRPVQVRNLLMRLEEAEKKHDVEMAVSTIEQIRGLPGSPAADLDDALARRLGALNVKRLFGGRNPQWVKSVTVKRGDSASRIASENGSTIASLACLNGGSVDKIILGAKLYVMDHPRFNLVIHRRTRTADLSLNGKFFKRYDLAAPVTGKEGAYEIPPRLRGFWSQLGVSFKTPDRTEIETLMPVGASVLISEM